MDDPVSGKTASERPLCIYETIEKKRRETYSAYRFLDCNNTEEGCILGCGSGNKIPQSQIGLIFAIVKEAYTFARYLYALQKSLEEGKDFFGNTKA